MQEATQRSSDLDQNIRRVFQVAVEGSAELASIQTQQFDTSKALALDLHQSLDRMRTVEVQDLVAVIGQISGQLVMCNPSYCGKVETDRRPASHERCRKFYRIEPWSDGVGKPADIHPEIDQC